LKLPDEINGFYLDPDSNKIIKVNRLTEYDRFGVVKTHDQAKGIVAPTLHQVSCNSAFSFYQM
jgi:hypothetical protein